MGVYYGKQESEGTKADIEEEIGQLTEEILGVQQEGEMILFMDANAKIGLMKEPVSRNGKQLLKKGTFSCQQNLVYFGRRSILQLDYAV